MPSTPNTMERENFGTKFGVLVAMAGSAIGLGNLWRFPYLVGSYGGAAFIFVYIICVFVLCLPILFSEVIVGRRSHANAFGAFKKLAPGSRWKWLGALSRAHAADYSLVLQRLSEAGESSISSSP